MQQQTESYNEQIAKIKADTAAEIAKVEDKVKHEIHLRIQAQEKAEAETSKRKQLEAQMQQQVESYNGQIAKIKADAAAEIVKAKADVADTTAKLKPQLKQKPGLPPQSNDETEQKTNAKTIQSPPKNLLEKVDKIIKDRGIIY